METEKEKMNKTAKSFTVKVKKVWDKTKGAFVFVVVISSIIFLAIHFHREKVTQVLQNYFQTWTIK